VSNKGTRAPGSRRQRVKRDRQVETWESSARSWPADAADKGLRRAYAANGMAFKAVIEALPAAQRAEGQRLLSYANGDLGAAAARLEKLRRLGDADALTALLRPLIETSIVAGAFDEICSEPEADAP
jgi:hypothetical protein